MARFTNLPKTSYSGIEFDNIIEDIINIIKDNPDYSDSFDDFLSSNAGRMLVELFAYITDQLATRIDWISNENFLSTATKKQSVINLLKLIGYEFSLPEAAKLELTLTLPETFSSYDNNLYFTKSSEESPYYITIKDKNGSSKIFEALNFHSDGKIIDYLNRPLIASSMVFVEGKTYVKEVTIDTDNNFTVELDNYPVIKDSIQIYRSDEKLTHVSSFLDPKAQYAHSQFLEDNITQTGENYPIAYKTNIEEGDKVIIEFPNSSIVPNAARRPSVGDIIKIYYRIGGGVNGNVPARRLVESTKTLTLYDADGVTSTHIIKFSNYKAGYEGANSETMEHAIEQAPLSIQTAKKAVTESDYDAIFSSFSDIIKSKSIGHSNYLASSDELYSLYGTYIHPLEVWNFIVKYKEGWENLKPSEYKYVEWFTSRLPNYFNSQHAFRDGVLSYESNKTESDIDTSNIITIDMGSTFTENAEDTDFKCKVTQLANTNVYFDTINELNMFNPIYTENSGLLSYNGDTYDSIEENVRAILLSKANLLTNIEYEGSGENIEITIDSHTETITFAADTSYTAEGIVSLINDAFISDAFTYDAQQAVISSSVGEGLDLLTVGTHTFTLNGGTYSIAITDTDDVNTNDKFTSVLQDAVYFTIEGTIIKNSSEITNITHSMDRIFIGMQVKLPDNNVYIITEKHWADKYVVLSGNSSVSGTYDTIKVTGYNITNSTNTVTIKNLGEAATNATDMVDFAFETAGVFSSITNYDASGSKSYHDLGVAELYSSDDGLTKKILLKSMLRGSSSSILIGASSSPNLDVLNDVFGLNLTTQSEATGTRTLTYNIEGENIFGLSIAHNSPYFYTGSQDYFITYLISDDSEIILGQSFSSLELSDPKYRNNIDRIYNTVYDTGSKEINYFSSNFGIKLTKEETESASLYSIINDWNLTENSFPQIVSTVSEVTMFDTWGSSLSGYSIDVTLKIGDDTEQNFIITDSSTEFTSLTEIRDSINNKMQINLSGQGMLANFEFASIINGYLTITLPYNFENSFITFEDDSTPETVYLDSVSDMFGSSSMTDTSAGDYYLKLDTSLSIPMMKLYKTTGSNFPDYSFYIHFIADKRIVDNIYDGKQSRPGIPFGSIDIDEDALNTEFYNYKIPSIDNVYKSPIFNTFNIKANIIYNKFYSKDIVKANIEEALQNYYSFTSSEIGGSVYKSKIASIIDSVNGINNFNITYLGRDATDLSTDEGNEIIASFNEVLVLHENYPISSLSENREHGIIITYTRGS